MNLKEFKTKFYNDISDYWNFDEEDKRSEYPVVNIIESIPEILKNIKIRKFGLSPVHKEYLEYFYDFTFSKTASPRLSDDEKNIFINTKRDENIQSEIVEKIEIRKKIRNKKYEIEEKIVEIRDKLRVCVYNNIAKKHSGKNFEGEEGQNYVYNNKIITNEKVRILEKYMKLKILEKYPENKKILQDATNTIEEISKQIKELTKKKWVKIQITQEIKNKRQNIEEKYTLVLFKFLKSRKLIDDFLKEISKDSKHYEYKRIVSFYTPTIGEAKDRLEGELPLAKHNIKATGYYPFTKIKIEGDDENEIKEIEINWWIKFLKSGKDVWKDGLQKKGFDFLKKIDLYYDIEN